MYERLIDALRIIKPNLVSKVVKLDATEYAAFTATQKKEHKKRCTEAVVVIGTCMHIGADVYSTLRPKSLLVDEAGQVPDSLLIIPLSRGANRLVLIGDHYQLPPTYLNDLNKDQVCSGTDYKKSVMERLIISKTLEPVVLDIQRRLHASIAHWAFSIFYRGTVMTPDIQRSSRRICGFRFKPKTSRIQIFNCFSGYERKSNGSISNRGEAMEIQSFFRKFSKLNPDLEYGIITPYRGQKAELTKLLLNGHNNKKNVSLEINTVDAFQGREKDVIILSLTRCNSESELGFLTNPNRANVMFTRAKCCLFVFMNVETFDNRESNKQRMHGPPQTPSSLPIESENFMWAHFLLYCRHMNIIHEHGVPNFIEHYDTKMDDEPWSEESKYKDSFAFNIWNHYTMIENRRKAFKQN